MHVIRHPVWYQAQVQLIDVCVIEGRVKVLVGTSGNKLHLGHRVGDGGEHDGTRLVPIIRNDLGIEVDGFDVGIFAVDIAKDFGIGLDIERQFNVHRVVITISEQPIIRCVLKTRALLDGSRFT